MNSQIEIKMDRFLFSLLVLMLSFIPPSFGVTPEKSREILPSENYRFGYHLSWLPDNERVVTRLISKSDKKGIPQIGVVNVEDNAVKLLSEANLKHSYPVSSPDGKWIAFIGPMEDHSSLWIMDTQGKNKRRLVDVQCWQRPAWAPGSEGLAFTSRQWDIWVVNLDGTGLAQLTSGPGAKCRPQWSPDAGLIAYEQNAKLWCMKADGTDKKLLSVLVSEPGFSPIGTADDHHFNWSPDGQNIIYAYRPIPSDGKRAIRDGQIHPYQIWAVDLDTSHKSCLTPDDMSCGLPSYLPDGRHILFAHTYKWVVAAAVTVPAPSYPNRNIWMLDLATNTLKQLTEGITIREFAVSPDGRKVAFADEGPRLFVLPIE